MCNNGFTPWWNPLQKAHANDKCTVFVEFGNNECWEAVTQHHLCRMRVTSHRRARFAIKKTCGINGDYIHHPLLHNHKSTPATNVVASKTGTSGVDKKSINTLVLCTNSKKMKYPSDTFKLFYTIKVQWCYRMTSSMMVLLSPWWKNQWWIKSDWLCRTLIPQMDRQYTPRGEWTKGSFCRDFRSKWWLLQIPSTKVHIVQSLHLPTQSVNAVELTLVILIYKAFRLLHMNKCFSYIDWFR